MEWTGIEDEPDHVQMRRLTNRAIERLNRQCIKKCDLLVAYRGPNREHTKMQRNLLFFAANGYGSHGCYSKVQCSGTVKLQSRNYVNITTYTVIASMRKKWCTAKYASHVFDFGHENLTQFNSIYFVFDRSKGVVNPQDIEHVNI